jgi:hypothetical protein
MKRTYKLNRSSYIITITENYTIAGNPINDCYVLEYLFIFKYKLYTKWNRAALREFLFEIKHATTQRNL